MDYSALLGLLLNLNDATSVDTDEVLLYLQQFKDGLLKLLDFKVGQFAFHLARSHLAAQNWRLPRILELSLTALGA
jgi:hypothetical protein